ncbi:MAG: class I SAM-dependent methyltransferase [Bacteroidales bacterium]|nr:class I SAM-dependent methyltransferase [Bacteroidales bacterium]
MHYEYPEAFARFYDVMYRHLRDAVDHEFYMHHITKTKGRILEVGVGTGRFFRDALANGADIYGIDISGAMLEVLKSNLEASHHHRISRQSIVDFSFDGKFDLIIAPFRVMMHLPDKEEQLAALNNVYRHLNTGGVFIFDAFVPDLNQLLHPHDRTTDFDGEYQPGKKLRRSVSTDPDLINQTIHVTFLLEWDENGKNNQEVWKVPLRFFFRYELEHLVERSKFSHSKILGDFYGNDLKRGSREFIVFCAK